MEKRLKIAFITEMYSERMGYSENFLPKAVARLGHEVHVIASTAQVYFNSPSYKKTYEPFLGPNITSPGVKEIDGYTLHRLPLKRRVILQNVIRMKGLQELLIELSPDVIQPLNIYTLSCYQAARAAKRIGAAFFTESHIHASVFDMGNTRTRLKYYALGFPAKLREINRITVKHYPIARDVAELSVKYFLVPPEKVQMESLGVDTDLFTPVDTDEENSERNLQRETLGFSPDDIVCIYTGRFTSDKNPQCLARAVNDLQQRGHLNVKGLFVGSGTPEDVAYIQSMQGCVVHPFVPVSELPRFYQAADIGVWPRQESMSQLDAAACGLPLILSNRIAVKERTEGNGLLYEQDDDKDLAERILDLQDPAVRKRMGINGYEKVRSRYSWEAVAKRRIADFKQELDKRS